MPVNDAAVSSGARLREMGPPDPRVAQPRHGEDRAVKDLCSPRCQVRTAPSSGPLALMNVFCEESPLFRPLWSLKNVRGAATS